MHAMTKDAHIARWQADLGLHTEVVRRGDGWTVYVFSQEVEGMIGRRQLFEARGWREAEAFVAGWTLCKGGNNGRGA